MHAKNHHLPPHPHDQPELTEPFQSDEGWEAASSQMGHELQNAKIRNKNIDSCSVESKSYINIPSSVQPNLPQNQNNLSHNI